MMPRKSSMVFINYSEYSCVWCFCLVWLNESWWQKSNDGLWDFSLKCLWSLLRMDIFLSTVPLPATSLAPRSSQLQLYVYLLAIVHIILCSSRSSDNCQVHIQLIPKGLSSIHCTLLSFFKHFSYFHVPYSNCSSDFLTSSMASPLKWELMILSVSLSIHPTACKNVWAGKKQRCSKSWKFYQHNIITQIESKRLHELSSVTFTSVDVSVKECVSELLNVVELNAVCKYLRSQLPFERNK